MEARKGLECCEYCGEFFKVERIYMIDDKECLDYCGNFYCLFCNPRLCVVVCMTHHRDNVLVCSRQCKVDYATTYRSMCSTAPAL